MDPSSFSSHEPYCKADHFKGGGSPSLGPTLTSLNPFEYNLYRLHHLHHRSLRSIWR
jgi:hypothetical protein